MAVGGIGIGVLPITLLGKVSATLTIRVPVIHVTSTILLVLRW